MKRILFDHQIFRNQPYGGISKYFSEIITNLRNQPGYKVLPRKFYSENVNLTNNALTRLSRFKGMKHFPGKGKVEKIIMKQEEISTLEILQDRKFEIFHPTYYNPYFLSSLPANKPMVLTVHDMIHENYYDHHYEYLLDETVWKRQLIPRADHIIAVSAYTKSQILKYFPGVDEQKISVIHHGMHMQQPGETNLKLPEKYLLYVGIRKHYKNFIWLAKSLGDYLKQNNIKLLCAGAKEFDAYEKDIFNQYQLNGYVQHLPINHNNELAAVYANAMCFIFPSLEEGFGIPILEAFANNCPALLSNSSCFPEIAADASLYFAPGNKDDLLKKVDEIITQNTVRDALIASGKKRIKQFTWENTAQQHIDIYNSLLAK